MQAVELICCLLTSDVNTTVNTKMSTRRDVNTYYNMEVMRVMKYYITVLPGIESIAQDEMVTKWPSIRLSNTLRARNNSLLLFEFDGGVSNLLNIRTAEDLFVLLGKVELSGGKQDLESLKLVIQKAPNFELALAIHRQIRKQKRRRQTTFRVVAQATRELLEYRRIDAQKAVERGMSERYHRKWKVVDDDADLEIWLHLINDSAIMGLRISDKTMRHRTYKVEHIPASLRPTIAFALVWASRIEDDDIFLDPMCGAATIIIERAQAERYKQLLGGDISSEAIRVAKENIGKKYKPIEIRIWDARQLPLSEESVTKVVSNLPFGRQIGSHTENKILYQQFFREVHRVLKTGGRAVFLSSEWELVKDNLALYPSFKLVKHYKGISVLGYHADIFVIDKA